MRLTSKITFNELIVDMSLNVVYNVEIIDFEIGLVAYQNLQIDNSQYLPLRHIETRGNNKVLIRSWSTKKAKWKEKGGIFYSVTYALSPCCERSRPTSSSFGVTRIPPGQTRSITLIISAVMPTAHAKAANAPIALFNN